MVCGSPSVASALPADYQSADADATDMFPPDSPPSFRFP